MKIKEIILVFEGNEIRNSDIPKFRGYISSKYPNYEIIHNHLMDGSFRYSYPLIQFKTIERKPAIIGINEGIELLKKVFMEIEDIKIGEQRKVINEKSILLREEEFGTADDFINYRFLSPWMALNQENYKKYNRINRYDQMAFLKHLLRENLKTISKGFGYTIPDIDEVKVDGRFIKRMVNFKNIKMLCFVGSFITNFYIPEYLGIGKQVARGFGMVGKI
ncbi:MAG TPA: hypothetical protein ENL20_13045 [Candidatus Cloacimonetes bacterium]|nr:hypothetical protein [Candidatus Cloacimonadota bacterium]